MYGLNILPYDSTFPGLPNRTSGNYDLETVLYTFCHTECISVQLDISILISIPSTTIFLKKYTSYLKPEAHKTQPLLGYHMLLPGSINTSQLCLNRFYND